MAEEKRNRSHVQMGADVFKGQSVNDVQMGANLKVKKRLPLWVDILTGIIMLAIVCGVVVGSYMLFRYYSNDYGGVEVAYTVILEGIPAENTAKYYDLKDRELFMDTDANSVYFGKISAVKIENERVFLTVNAEAKHRGGEGYSIEDTRLAVGSELALRCGQTPLIAEVVALEDGGN